MKNKNQENAIKEEIQKSIKSQKIGLDANNVFHFYDAMTVKEFALNSNLNAADILTYFFNQGKLLNINHILSENQILELCEHYNFDFQKKQILSIESMIENINSQNNENLIKKNPIITIMGHVDHGKTTLIDHLRKSNIAKNEKGGITQHTGAYQIIHKNQKITFLDTPGHEAFTSMRARGANITNIVILVVAADDGVKPQTIEAIDHSLNAKVPIIVFVNKMDKENIDVERIKSDLATNKIICEEWGGEYPFIFGSALKGQGVNELLDVILAQSELLELKANPNHLATGIVVESYVEKNKGVITTIIITNGTLYKKDFVVAGANYGSIRKIINSKNEEINEIKPGDPGIIYGLNGVPEAGDYLFCFKDEKFAKYLAKNSQEKVRRKNLESKKIINEENGIKILNILIKADAKGTLEALKSSLLKIENEEVKVNIISASIGIVSKSDILLASVANAIIYGYNIKSNKQMNDFAKEKKVQIKIESIIFKIIEEVKELVISMKKPVYEKKLIGQARIIKVIFSSKIGNIAGSLVLENKIQNKCFVKIYRKNKLIKETYIKSLFILANEVKKVNKGNEFGCVFNKFNEIQEDDIFECYEEVKVIN